VSSNILTFLRLDYVIVKQYACYRARVDTTMTFLPINNDETNRDARTNLPAHLSHLSVARTKRAENSRERSMAATVKR